MPLAHVTLEPGPVAGQGKAPIKAQVRRVGLSEDLLRGGANLDKESRIAVEIDLFNSDSQRQLAVSAPGLIVGDALGGAAIVGRPVFFGDGGLPNWIDPSDAANDPPRFVLRPGETRTLWVAYAGFPEDGPHRPVRADVRIDVEGAQPLALAIADPIPGGSRWKVASGIRALYIGAAMSSLDIGARAGSTDMVLAPISFEVMGSRGRFLWGFGVRAEWLYREALASGPPALGFSPLATAGFVPWRFPIGAYAEVGEFFGIERPPTVYARLDGVAPHNIALPRVGAGLLFQVGPRLSSTGPFPIERPMSPLRRFMFRVGYAHWFNLGDTAGLGGLQFAFGAAVGP